MELIGNMKMDFVNKSKIKIITIKLIVLMIPKIAH
jgi:hypothetical protein